MWTPLFSLETEGLCDFTQCRDMTTVNLCAHDYPCNSTHSRAKKNSEKKNSEKKNSEKKNSEKKL